MKYSLKVFCNFLHLKHEIFVGKLNLDEIHFSKNEKLYLLTVYTV